MTLETQSRGRLDVWKRDIALPAHLEEGAALLVQVLRRGQTPDECQLMIGDSERT